MTTDKKIKNIIENKQLSAYFGTYLTAPVNLLHFTEFFFETVQKNNFFVNWHHILISDKLNEVLQGTHPTNHIMFNIPPRHTKTELAVINFTALGFAINPESEFMHLSASDALVTRNTTMIRNIMESELYRCIFPGFQLTNNAKASISTNKGGVFYTAPFLGQITGFGCGKLGSEKFSGAMLIDDPIKTQDALSNTIREKVNFTWANTLVSRKNDQRTPVIITAQRVHEKDFCGFLIEEEGTTDHGGKWDLIRIPAIIEESGEEKSLWDFRLSLDALKKQRELDSWVFDTQYMQNPKPIEGLLFHESTTKYYDELPSDPDYIHIQIDPADEGTNYTCSSVYHIKGEQVFMADVIYTRDNTDFTIPRILDQIKRSGAATACIEANSAWMIFARNIREKAAEEGLSTKIIAMTNHENKEIRVFNHAPYIVRNFHYPKAGDREWQLYLKHKHSYLKMVKNQTDDGVDCDASACAWMKKNRIIPNV